MITKISQHNFSVAFEQMCSIVAIGKTKSHEETLSELIIQCLAIFPEEKFKDVKEIQDVINNIFGLDIVEHEIADVITKLKQQGVLSGTTSLELSTFVQAEAESKIQEAKQLEDSVRETWRSELLEKHPSVNINAAWQSLQKYLAFAYQRHGIQAISLLNPAVEIPDEYTNSLSSILTGVINENFRDGQQNNARNAISEFMATTGNTPARYQYIAQLADGAFNYYNLTISPEVATNFQTELNPLSIFLDTNFLFGILNIDVGPQVAVSNELIRVINDYNLPFKLLAHESTINELITSIDHKERELKARNWSKSISRAAAQSRYLSGVELKYHQLYAETGIDVESYFAPYKHADVLIEQQGIEIFHDEDTDRDEVHWFIAEYSDFLDSMDKHKGYELIDHDMTVLHRVKTLRSESKSTLDAKAIFMTCDFTLYRFDSNYCKEKSTLVSTVLPNMFWQIIRPYIPSNEMFDKAFAETFAIPEFRTIGSSAARACSKMLHILAGLKDFPEETAANMLSNDLLIRNLESAETDEEFQAYVDSQIVRENEELLSRNKELQTSLINKDNVLQDTEQILDVSRQNIEKLSSTVQGMEENITEIENKFEEVLTEKEGISIKFSDTSTQLEDLKDKNKKLQDTLHAVLLVAIGLIIVAIIESVIHIVPLKIVLSYKRPILLQIVINFWIVTCVLGFLDKENKNKWWGGSFVGFIANLLAFLFSF